MKARLLLLLLTLLSIFSSAQDTRLPVNYVNTLMGTDSRYDLSNGNTYPAVGAPWGMNYWVAQTNTMGNGWQYQYGASKIVGFKQTHQPSPWMNDFGCFSVMPGHDMNKFREKDRAAWFSHKSEMAGPSEYSVYLADLDITTVLTATERCAQFVIRYPAQQPATLVIDAFNKGSYIKILPEQKRIIGYSTRNSGGAGPGFKNYFIIDCSDAFEEMAVWHDSTLVSGEREITADHSGAVVRFAGHTEFHQVRLKVASSFISWEQAELNLKNEIVGDDFTSTQFKTFTRWNELLSRVQIKDDNLDHIRTFYSCLYRTLCFPQKLYELDAKGQPIHYSPYDGKVHPGYLFGGTGFWDTFRALYPLLNLLYPEINREMQAGLVNDFKEGGFLPEWSSPGFRNVMIGNNSASVVADAVIKGLKGYDQQTLFQALVHGANNEGPMDAVGRKGVSYYNTLGYVPYDVNINENAARTLEYAYDDFCIAQMAAALHMPADTITKYRKRAMNYQNLFDKNHLLMRGKNKDGSFQSPFNPFKWGDAFTEGNSWHYTWSVFQDIEGLKRLMGGNQKFVDMLDSIWAMPPVFDDSYYGGVIHEIREMQLINLGQYAHGNQPIQHMIYLYNYADAPWKTQFHVRQVMEQLYKATPDGYCGDEDNGQTSAWYVFSALGFYPVTPATDQYVIGSPLFKEVTLKLPEGKSLKILAENNGPRNLYVGTLSKDGQLIKENWISHKELMKGGLLKFQMFRLADLKRGVGASTWPFSLTK